MPIGDIIANADIANKPEDLECGCHPHHHYPICPEPQPVWFVPPPMPMPIPADYPVYNPYKKDCDCDKDKDKEEEEAARQEALKASIEVQICKLSRRAAAIKAMIDSFKNKNKDAIIRVGGVSYNFGSYKKIVKDEEGNDVATDSEYGEAILAIFTNELTLIKEKISELAAKLEEEEDAISLTNGIYTTIDRD